MSVLLFFLQNVLPSLSKTLPRMPRLDHPHYSSLPPSLPRADSYFTARLSVFWKKSFSPTKALAAATITSGRLT